jgi:hypothetical protein
LYALLLFGGHITVDHVRGGGRSNGRDIAPALLAPDRHTRPTTPVRSRSRSSSSYLNFKFIVLYFFYRRLLDGALLRAFDSGRVLEVAESPVVGAMLTLLTSDGMATNARVSS